MNAARSTKATGLFVLLLVLAAYPLACLANGAASCKPGAGDLACVDEHFDEVYANDYKGFWEILNSRAAEVRVCRDDEVTTNFLALVQHVGNAEFAELYSQTIEELAVADPTCLARAWEDLPVASREQVVSALKNPLFKPKDEIARAGKSSDVAKSVPAFAEAMGW